jgi:hypothetical protein
MPSLSSSRLAYLDAGDYTDCYCVRIVRRDGQTLRFTSYPRDLTIFEKWDASSSPQLSSIAPVTYRSNTGNEMTAVSQSATLAIDNIDIMGIYESAGVTKADLLAGVYDGAQVYIFLTNYENPIEDEHPIKKAIYGITKVLDETFKIEFRGLTQFLNQEVGRKITTLSSKTLAEEGAPTTATTWQASTAYATEKATYDWRPGGTQADVVQPSTPNGFWYYLSAAGNSGGTEPSWPTSAGSTVADGGCEWTAFHAYAYTATVTSVTDNGEFSATGLIGFPDDWFADGWVTFSTGNNTNKTLEVLDFTQSGGVINLRFNAPLDIAVGDTFTAHVGYDRTLAQCRDKFANTVNFGGFPYLPGPRTAARVGTQ